MMSYTVFCVKTIKPRVHDYLTDLGKIIVDKHNCFVVSEVDYAYTADRLSRLSENGECFCDIGEKV